MEPDLANIGAEKLASLLEWIERTASSAEGFVLEQAPLLAREIVEWCFWQAAWWTGLGVTVIIAAIIVGVVGLRALKVAQASSGRSDDDMVAFAKVFAAGFALVFGLGPGVMMVANNAPDMIKASVAPRIVILDYIRPILRR